MGVKHVTLKDGSRRHFGRRWQARKPLCPHFRDYLRATYSPPASQDWIARVATWAMYLNNNLGDCVIAGLAHLINLWTTWFYGEETQFTDADITSMYSAIGGYVPGDESTDNGCVINPTALNYLVSPGFVAGEGPPGTPHTAIGWAQIDGTNRTEVSAAIALTGVVLIGFGVPDAWIQSWKGDGTDVWDVGPGISPNPSNGHCIMFGAYDSTGVEAINWGAKVKITWAAVTMILNPAAQGEAYAIVSNDWVASGKAAPNGLALAPLVADTNAIAGGNIPTPNVSPPVPVVPPTVPPVSPPVPVVPPTPVVPPVSPPVPVAPPTPVVPPPAPPAPPPPATSTGQVSLTGTLEGSGGLFNRGGTLTLEGTVITPLANSLGIVLDPAKSTHTFDLAVFSANSTYQGRAIAMLQDKAKAAGAGMSLIGTSVTLSQGTASSFNWTALLAFAAQVLAILAAAGLL